MQTQIRRMELVRAIPDPLWSLYRSARGVVGKLRRTTGNLLFPHVVEKLRRTGAPSDNEKLWKLATRGFYGLIYPFQNRTEFLGLLGVLRRARPRVMMEIGTALGGTLFMFMRVAADDAAPLASICRGAEAGAATAWSGFRFTRRSHCLSSKWNSSATTHMIPSSSAVFRTGSRAINSISS